MAKENPIIKASKRLCEESKDLRAESKITVAECKAAIAHSQETKTRIAKRLKFIASRPDRF
jgi:hypothetical protein